MLKLHQILVTVIALAASAVVLNGCGQKGPLVLPPDRKAASAPKPAPIGISPTIPSSAASSSQ